MDINIKKYKDFFESSSKSKDSDGLDIDDLEKLEIDKDLNSDMEDYYIEEILDVISDPEQIKESFGTTIGTHADFGVKETKRGDIIWVTAMLRKKGTTSFTSPAVQGVIKCRVVDLYYGLTMLNKVMKQ